MAMLPGFEGDVFKLIKNTGAKVLARSEVVLTAKGPLFIQGINHDRNQLAGKFTK